MGMFAEKLGTRYDIKSIQEYFMSTRKLISAALVTGMATASAQAAQDNTPETLSERSAAETSVDKISHDWDLATDATSVPALFGGDASATDTRQDMVIGPDETDILFGVTDKDAEALIYGIGNIDGDEFLSLDVDPEYDDFDLAQTVFGGGGSRKLSTTIVGNSPSSTLQKRPGSAVKQPSVGTTIIGSGVRKPRNKSGIKLRSGSKLKQ